jgi:hypothetical protein
MHCYFLFYVFSILWCSQIDDHQPKDLIKFGYRSNMRVKEVLRILLYFCYMLEPIVKNWWFELFFQNMASLRSFLTKNKILCLCYNHIFTLIFFKNPPPKKHDCFVHIFMWKIKILSTSHVKCKMKTKLPPKKK